MITPTNQLFCYWLQGYFEIGLNVKLNKRTIILISQQLDTIQEPFNEKQSQGLDCRVAKNAPPMTVLLQSMHHEHLHFMLIESSLPPPNFLPAISYSSFQKK